MLDAKKISVTFEKGKMKVKRRAEITLYFHVPEAEATEDFLDALIGSMKQNLSKDFGKDAFEIEGRWI